jgi:hypothetical protein
MHGYKRSIMRKLIAFDVRRVMYVYEALNLLTDEGIQNILHLVLDNGDDIQILPAQRDEVIKTLNKTAYLRVLDPVKEKSTSEC